MKKRLLLTLLFFSTAFLFSEESLFDYFTFEPSFGFINGTIVENVWYVNSTHSGNSITYTPAQKQSRLDWQLQNTPYTGFNLNINFSHNTVITLDFNTAFSGEFGIMEDYDWLNPVKWPNDPPDELTNYSWHSNIIKQFSQVKFYAGHTFNINTKLFWTITPGFGFITQSFNFEGFGGYKTYKQDKWKKIEFEQSSVISYSQTFVAPYAELKTYLDFNYFDTSLALSAAFIEKLNCVDLHLKRSLYFNDRLEYAWLFGGTLKLMYNINSINKIGLKATAQFSPDSYGFTYSAPDAETPIELCLGGSSRFVWTYSLVYAFTIK